jgi:hypothetical protein
MQTTHKGTTMETMTKAINHPPTLKTFSKAQYIIFLCLYAAKKINYRGTGELTENETHALYLLHKDADVVAMREKLINSTGECYKFITGMYPN